MPGMPRRTVCDSVDSVYTTHARHICDQIRDFDDCNSSCVLSMVKSHDCIIEKIEKILTAAYTAIYTCILNE